MIEAKVVCDSTSHGCRRLTTFELTYPRFIHAEFMTHRAFSRNAASSRAIPIDKAIQAVIDNPAIPEVWGVNKAGMQAHEVLSRYDVIYAHRAWLHARDAAVHIARELQRMGLHKQIVNRVIEPWSHITVVCTATDYANFFALRDHPAAEPHIRRLAVAMKEALDASTPTHLSTGQWHLPYVSAGELEEQGRYSQDLVRYSVARCARVSYLNHDKSNPSHENDIRLHDSLVVSQPVHASPAEHQAYPFVGPGGPRRPDLSGNFSAGWVQYRKTLANECVVES